MFTIHGFCRRILQELVFETRSRFDVELLTSQESLIQQAVDDFAATWWTGKSPVASLVPLTSGLRKTMCKVVALALANPTSPVVPDSGELQASLGESSLGAFDQAVAGLQLAWKDGKDEACKKLFDARERGWLNGNTHAKPGQLEASIKFIDLLVARPGLDLCLIDAPYRRRLAQEALIRGTVMACKDKAPSHDVFAKIESVLKEAGKLRDRGDQFRTCLLSKLAVEGRKRIEKLKADRGVMSFDDLLNDMRRALDGPHGDLLLKCLRKRYQVVMVDECQDTDSVQYHIFHRVFQETSPGPDGSDSSRAFVVIGDPKQSIYRFRGADIHSYLAASDGVPEANRHTMHSNWRSDAPLVMAVNAVFGSVRDPFYSDRIPFVDVVPQKDARLKGAPAFEITLVPRQGLQASNKEQKKGIAMAEVVSCVAADILTQLQGQARIVINDTDRRRIKPGDIAVLCRKGRHLRTIQRELAKRGVPAVLQTEDSVFEAPEARDVCLVLRAILNPGRVERINTALQTPIFGLSASMLASLAAGGETLAEWVRKFHRWNESLQDRGFVATWQQLLEEAGTVPRLAGQIMGERKITNYLHLGELLHQHATTAHAGPSGLLCWLERMIPDTDEDTSPLGRDSEENQIRLESDADSVQLCTIHKSKGLEYPIVYCPTLWDVFGGGRSGVSLVRRDDSGALLPNPKIEVDSTDSTEEPEERAEERRILYVALTRAKHQCRVYWTSATDSGDSSLGQIMLPGTPPEASDDDLEQALGKWVSDLKTPHVCLRRVQQVQAWSKSDRYVPDRGEGELRAKDIGRRKLSSLIQTSFSSLAHSMAAAEDVAEADRDEDSVDSPIQIPSGPKDQMAGLPPLADLPGGRKMGDLVHQILEDLLRSGQWISQDASVVKEAASQLVEKHLARVHLAKDWQEPLAGMLARCLTGQIPDVGEGMRLIDLPQEAVTCEMPFLLRAGLRDAPVDFKRFAEAFKKSENPTARQYAGRAGHIARSDMAGF
ncbi:MAG: UvrD-helicase domain-containing protein, partial [Planctomycetota bacterium]